MNLTGSFKTRKKDGTIYYRSSCTWKNKHISLGSFSTDLQAHEAYKTALELLNSSQISLEAYSSDCPLSFEKWVVLCNFRDNRIYFSTPIYVRSKFFHYYLEEHLRLTFDIDDLFFYASHKISRRGGHLFVAHYGMQLNLPNRYGIKNYAVEGKDYRFVNGDCHDFRYENIEIINSYQGVSAVTHKGQKKFKAVLHLKGNYTIGYYDSALIAAIAYNKAVDQVKKNGINRNFIQNETEGITPSAYAELYTKIKISPKIMDYQSSSSNGPSNQ
ncbi:MAG: hypothetical protein IJP31_03965 [Lachnospiraceae bacterium]|nr:hypothetical protein [Lachnospiraceae bacterium]